MQLYLLGWFLFIYLFFWRYAYTLWHSSDAGNAPFYLECEWKGHISWLAYLGEKIVFGGGKSHVKVSQ